MPNTYYISNSIGKAGNDGRSEQSPLPALDDVNKLVLQPGDCVLLRRGDVFANQHLKVQGGGSLRLRAPIVIDAYGQGPSPRLIGGISNRAAISLSHESASGGYIIRNLHIEDYKLGIACVKPDGTLLDGLRIEHCCMTGITTGVGWEKESGLDEGAALAYGILLENAQDVAIADVVLRDCDCPLRVKGRRMLIERVEAFDSGVQGFMVYGLGHGRQVLFEQGDFTIKNCRIIGVGRYGLRFGTTAVMTENINRCIIRDSEIAYVVNRCHNFDSCAMDWENNNVDCLIENVYAHDNDGPFLLAMEHNDDPASLGTSRGNRISRCLSVNNARRDRTQDGSFLNLSSYYESNQIVKVDNCVDIGPENSFPYSYDDRGNVRFFTDLQSDKIEVSGFISGVMDVEGDFFRHGMELFYPAAGAAVENGRLRLEEGAAVAAKFSGREYTVSLYLQGCASLALVSELGELVWTFEESYITVARVHGEKSEFIAQFSAEDLTAGGWIRCQLTVCSQSVECCLNDRLVGSIFCPVTESYPEIRALTPANVAELFVYRLTGSPRRVTRLLPEKDDSDIIHIPFEGNGLFDTESAWDKGPGIDLGYYTPRNTGYFHINGPDAFIEQHNLNVDADTHTRLLFCMSNDTEADCITVEFTSDGGIRHSLDIPVRRKNRDAFPFYLLDHTWSPYAADLSVHPDWKGRVRGLRLRFAPCVGYITVSDLYILTDTRYSKWERRDRG